MNKQKGESGIGILGLMFLIFLTLKLTSVINWPWWLITMPLWIMFLIIGIVAFFLVAIGAMRNKKGG